MKRKKIIDLRKTLKSKLNSTIMQTLYVNTQVFHNHNDEQDKMNHWFHSKVRERDRGGGKNNKLPADVSPFFYPSSNFIYS